MQFLIFVMPKNKNLPKEIKVRVTILSKEEVILKTL